MKTDWYANLLAIIDNYHYLCRCNDFTLQEESVTSMLWGEIGKLMEIRAHCHSNKALLLPKVHLNLITSLLFVSIVAYAMALFKVVKAQYPTPRGGVAIHGVTHIV